MVIPATRYLTADEAMRDWLDAYVPDRAGEAGATPPGDKGGALWAADVWYFVKKHWCLELQRLIRARRAAPAAG